jgi:uncharacterized protein (TIGR00645 family)
MRLGQRIEVLIQPVLFASRWLLAPFYFALASCVFVLMLKAGQHILHLVHDAVSSSESSVVLDTLSLIELTLTSSLVVLVIFSGFENFVSQVADDSDPNRPAWLTKIDFSGLKLKLMSSIVAISAIQTLRVFMDIANQSERNLMWTVGIQLTFVLSAALLALTDRISSHASVKTEDGDH